VHKGLVIPLQRRKQHRQPSQRATACAPRCSAELGSPIGEPSSCKRAGAMAARTSVSPAARQRLPEMGGPLRAFTARRGLLATLQCRVRNPAQCTRCVYRRGSYDRTHVSHHRRRTTSAQVGRSAAGRFGAQDPARLAAEKSREPVLALLLCSKSRRTTCAHQSHLHRQASTARVGRSSASSWSSQRPASPVTVPSCEP